MNVVAQQCNNTVPDAVGERERVGERDGPSASDSPRRPWSDDGRGGHVG